MKQVSAILPLMPYKPKNPENHWAVKAVRRLRAAHGLPDHFSPDDAIRAGLCTEDDWLDALNTERDLFWSGNGIQARTNVSERHPVQHETYPPELDGLLRHLLSVQAPRVPQPVKQLGPDFRKAVADIFSEYLESA